MKKKIPAKGYKIFVQAIHLNILFDNNIIVMIDTSAGGARKILILSTTKVPNIHKVMSPFYVMIYGGSVTSWIHPWPKPLRAVDF